MIMKSNYDSQIENFCILYIPGHVILIYYLEKGNQ